MVEASPAAYLSYPGAPPAGRLLCRVDDLPASGTKGFVFGEDTRRFELFVVWREGKLNAYVNGCPHAGTPLDVVTDQFMNLEQSHLLCGTHGALFRVGDGFCVAGPCRGKALTPVPVQIRDGAIYIV